MEITHRPLISALMIKKARDERRRFEISFEHGD